MADDDMIRMSVVKPHATACLLPLVCVQGQPCLIGHMLISLFPAAASAAEAVQNAACVHGPLHAALSHGQ